MNLFENKIIGRLFIALAIVAYLSYEMLNISICYFYFMMIFIAIYSAGYYYVQNKKVQFIDKLFTYNIIIFTLASIFFIYTVIKCIF